MNSINVEMSDDARDEFLKKHDEIKRKIAEALIYEGMKITPVNIEKLQQKAKAIIEEHKDISLFDERFCPHKVVAAEVDEKEMRLNLTIEVRDPILSITIPKEELEKWKPQMEKLLKELDDETNETN